MSPLTAIASLPTCKLGLDTTPDGLIGEIRFLPPDALLCEPDSACAEQFLSNLAQYLTDPHHLFSLPLAARGTAFQQRVWQRIRSIPAGQICQYGDLADELGSAARAVGQACGANPFPLVTPCHRVLGKSGPGGFAHSRGGWLLETKRWLLQHEGVKP